MFCRHCGATLPDDSHFCSRCGKTLVAEAAPASLVPPSPPLPRSPAPLPPPSPRPSPPEPETDLWSGGRSMKSMAGLLAMSFLWVVAVSAAALYFRFLGRYSLPVAVLALLPGLYVLAWMGWERLRVRYRLTTARLFKSEGVLLRRHMEMDLIRVDDVTVVQTLLDRIFDAGAVIVHSSDATDPVLRLDGIEKPHDVKERIRDAVQRRRRGAVYLESI